MNGMDAVAGLAARFALGGDQEEALEAYVDLLDGWQRGNLTGLHGRARIVEVLLGDALALLDVPQLLERADASWLDLGAGAGIPGIPLAVALPCAELTLLESAAKKCVFLQAAVAAAGLKARAHVMNARSEHYAAPGQPGREAFAVVLARAVAPLPVLLELAAPLLAPGSVLLASKTSRALAAEWSGGEAVAKLCGLAPGPVVPLPRSPLGESVCVVYEKVAETPDRVPRRPGVAGKRPLAG
jgi:16S rRNA (guanine527-N7)-methyltransferase